MRQDTPVLRLQPALILTLALTRCAKPPLCYDFSNVATYLAKPEVQATLGVTGHKWCAPPRPTERAHCTCLLPTLIPLAHAAGQG